MATSNQIPKFHLEPLNQANDQFIDLALLAVYLIPMLLLGSYLAGKCSRVGTAVKFRKARGNPFSPRSLKAK